MITHVASQQQIAILYRLIRPISLLPSQGYIAYQMQRFLIKPKHPVLEPNKAGLWTQVRHYYFQSQISMDIYQASDTHPDPSSLLNKQHPNTTNCAGSDKLRKCWCAHLELIQLVM